jgi:DNA-binding NarL/FixJ family response regulator
MDPNMGGTSSESGQALDGIEATRRIIQDNPNANVLVVTMYEDDEAVFGALRARLKRFEPSARWANGEAIFGPGVATRVMRYFATPRRSTPAFPT